MALVEIQTYAQTLETKTNIRVILPTPLAGESSESVQAAYSSKRKYPALYLLHGTYGTGSDYTRFSRIESYAQDYFVAVVMMDTQNGCYRDMPRGGPKYIKYVTEELPQMMEWMFPISSKREDRFLCGLSMGGTGCFKLGMLRPDLYGNIACMSSNFGGWQQQALSDNTPWSMAFEPGENLSGTDEDMFWLAEQAAKNKEALPEIYTCVGEQDFLYEGNQKFEEHLNRLGIKHTYHTQPGIHNWDFWDDELRRILAWLPIEKREGKNWF